MDVDAFEAPLEELLKDVGGRLEAIETEADARFQLIDRLLIEALGWGHEDFRMEPHNPSGYTDYLVQYRGTPALVVEAKRIGKLSIDTADPKLGKYKIGGPALKSAAEGFTQAASYCLEHGVEFAALTSGTVWIAFMALRASGKSFREYKAFVFPNISSIQSNFATFYDLFSKEGMSQKIYRTHFAKLDGVSAKRFEPMLSVNKPNNLRLLAKTDLARELEPVLSSFFGDLSGVNDPELRRQCFVESRESRTADVTLQKMIGTISSGITALPTDTGRQIVERINAVMDTRRSENILIAGGEGAGKTTFITRFFEDVLEKPLKEACLVIRIDLALMLDDPALAPPNVTAAVKAEIERQLYAGGYPQYDDLLGLYFDEYQRQSDGEFRPLYERDKGAFKEKFGEFLHAAVRSDPFSYVARSLESVVKSRKLLPVFVFDNADSRSVAFQEAVFEWSQTVKRQVPLCLVMLPVSDRTIWRMSREGPLRTSDGRIFYLPTPSTKEVLEKRIRYLIDNSAPQKGRAKYFLEKGIGLKLTDINAFAACVEEIFINEDFISRRIGWLTNHNLLRTLELTRDTITSPYLSIDELVASYLKHGGNSVPIKHRKFVQALIGGNYNQFDGTKHGYIRDVFETSADFPSSPLLTLSLLRLLIDKAGDQASNSSLGYVTYEHIQSYFGAMSADDDAVRDALARALANGLVEPFEKGDLEIANEQRFAVTSPGRMHYEMALRDAVYVSEMAFATPIRSEAAIDQMRAIKNGGGAMRTDQWREICKIFINYCIAEDRAFLVLPGDPMFGGQHQLRADLAALWGEQAMPVKGATNSTALDAVSRDQVRATVKWIDAAKGYGFLTDPESGEDVFVSTRLFRERMFDVPIQGSVVVCDVAPGKEGRPQAVSISSVEPAPEEGGKYVSARIKFYNWESGFGFATLASGDDAYLSRRLVEASDVQNLSEGAPVEVIIQPNSNRGMLATALRPVRSV
ncbi:cold shock domain-containing protein [Sphingomonas sp. CD22]|uniref:cold shock domain-containing protein n=1 Tax=Sphingomonas sp. CD22 TaxID=3100214 RepID=UPI002ADF8BEB|nr:cold shock domain-containing protein [Sphingomonas sp. CD22]MEA1086381.1 cold shock domain-containing protein [Sphingomonas sp. CD22]